jgi:hypothetical protein
MEVGWRCSREDMLRLRETSTDAATELSVELAWSAIGATRHIMWAIYIQRYPTRLLVSGGASAYLLSSVYSQILALTKNHQIFAAVVTNSKL